MKPLAWLLTSPSGGTHVTTSHAVFENAVAWGWTSIALGDVHAERMRASTIVREAAKHGLCCSDCEALADLIDGLGA